ncbi:CobQ/CobB/MinD/ParA nucleotide binding domain-containing protein [Desulfonispora thiosulfatigenes DSM 11270]|uniref:CobQ/CobB/MinD/ParA nucleotide binding domain-containing protein n=1 Tax=Desulfonispora thiosulfatigenes DSM 11270 TaxID=656914 RepID=A0A1W1V939_DESTI|nr:hypothetical protein [Desulfonispora thiosulfatigenes]SMB89783.1 CobQ/CobB/MinD/ParA nucleotide binding domain-containing protein [Desulfonispora thiosulfatigenes DSM 11270]
MSPEGLKYCGESLKEFLTAIGKANGSFFTVQGVDVHIGIRPPIAGSVDAFIVVVEPGQRSIQTAHSIVPLAKDLGVTKIFAIANKVRPSAEGFFQKNIDLPILAVIPFTETIIQADLNGETVWENNPELLKLGKQIYQNLCKELGC